MSREKEQELMGQILGKLGLYCEEATITPLQSGKYNLELVTTSGVTFQIMDKLAKEFNTQEINLSSETRNDGYCETCYHEYSVTVITIRNASSDLLGGTNEN